ncbi:IS1595 family transposase [Psychrobacter celer]|uniref:IS1595 family transposase n=1 Tax=Psychrobacter celer TaxID=306572 RepID=UPI003FD17AB4
MIHKGLAVSTTTKNIDILKQLFNNLSEQEKERFLGDISSQNNLEKVIESREISYCPHCDSTHFVKNGTKCNNQRYLCRDCKKSFVEQTGTILYNSQKDIKVWELYIHCMIEKYPLRKCAKICGINLATAFAWRHKILDALQNMMNDVELDGVVQADETFTAISYKGNHKSFKLPRTAYKRGTKASKRGLSMEKVCVPCAVNLDGLSVAKISNLGKPSLKDLQKVLDGNISRNSIFVTDSLRPYQKLSLDMELNHIRIATKKRSKGLFNIQTVNSYHSRLKDLVTHRFKGVSTKYLNNYLVYHNFVNFAKGTAESKESILLDFIRSTLCSSKTIDIAVRPAIPI